MRKRLIFIVIINFCTHAETKRPVHWKKARVKAIDTDRSVDQRLMVMGLLPGMDVKVVQIAPLGDPIAIEFQGRCVSLRKAEASGVLLDLLP